MQARSGLIPDLCPQDFSGPSRAGIWLGRSGLSGEFIVCSRILDGESSCLVTLSENIHLGAVIISNNSLVIAMWTHFPFPPANRFSVDLSA